MTHTNQANRGVQKYAPRVDTTYSEKCSSAAFIRSYSRYVARVETFEEGTEKPSLNKQFISKTKKKPCVQSPPSTTSCELPPPPHESTLCSF